MTAWRHSEQDGGGVSSNKLVDQFVGSSNRTRSDSVTFLNVSFLLSDILQYVLLKSKSKQNKNIVPYSCKCSIL